VRIRDIAHQRPRFGYQRIHVMLRREGWPVNKKRVRRLYRLEGLQLRMRMRRRKHMCLHRGVVPQAQRTHERWSMDFVHDQLLGGRPFRMLTVIDQFSRQSPLIEPGFAFGGRDVVAALERIIVHTGTPLSITVDHGTEFTSKALEEWAYQRGVKLDFTHPGKPMENGTYRVVQWSLALRVFERQSVHDARGCARADRTVAHRLQCVPST
jgi:putative transposase